LINFLAKLIDKIARRPYLSERETRDAEAELAQVRRVTAPEKLTASIAHEICQPLAAIVNNANASLRWLSGDSPNLVEAREAEWDEYTGRTEAVESVEIRPRVSGYIDRIGFKAGQLVKPGDVLFMIDPRPYQDALDQADAQPNPRPPEHRHSETTGKVARFNEC
jgi:signal transduction histidine kinase